MLAFQFLFLCFKGGVAPGVKLVDSWLLDIEAGDGVVLGELNGRGRPT